MQHNGDYQRMINQFLKNSYQDTKCIVLQKFAETKNNKWLEILEVMDDVYDELKEKEGYFSFKKLLAQCMFYDADFDGSQKI